MEPTNSGLIEQYGILKAKNLQDIPATKITKAFERAKQEGRGVLIPYFMCGFPSAEQHGLTLIFLIPPTTPNERIENIVARTRKGPGGFIYCVSLSGVTGSRKELPPHLHSFIERVRSYAKEIPLAVGFGLTTPEH